MSDNPKQEYQRSRSDWLQKLSIETSDEDQQNQEVKKRILGL